jgi:hypothetical protein
VKFIVNVKLIENSVNSHVGNVMVVKVMIQYKVPGSTPRTLRMTRARRPKVDEGVDGSTALTVTAAVCSASATVDTVDGRLGEAEPAAALRAAALDMVERRGTAGNGGPRPRGSLTGGRQRAIGSTAAAKKRAKA